MIHPTRRYVWNYFHFIEWLQRQPPAYTLNPKPYTLNPKP